MNPIEIVVIAEDGTEKSYSLNVERMPEEKRDSSFRDIAGHWAESSIESAIREGFVNGYPDGTFKPDHAVTRAEFAVMLARALKLEGEGVPLDFQDHETIGAWAEQAIAQAVGAGIVSGYADGTFRADTPITRVEMAVMLARAIGADLTVTERTSFVDDENIPELGEGSRRSDP